MKMSENPEKNMTWSHTSFISKLIIPGLKIIAFLQFANMLIPFNVSGCDIYCHSDSHQAQT